METVSTVNTTVGIVNTVYDSAGRLGIVIVLVLLAILAVCLGLIVKKFLNYTGLTKL